jgi:membrane protein
LLRCVESFNEDRIPAAAAGITFYLLLAIFPALAAFVSLYGLVGDVDGARRQLSVLGGLLPDGAIGVLSEELGRLASTNHGSLSMAFVISLVVSIWSSNAGARAMIDGLNVAYESKERRGFIGVTLVSLAFTIGVIALTIIAAALSIDAPAMMRALGLPNLHGIGALRWPILVAATTTLISVLYWLGPSRPLIRWRYVLPGAAFAAIAWMAMSGAFSWYVANFGHYDKTYGALGATVGFLTWIWISLMVVLLGAELNSEVEKAGSLG